MLRNRQRTSAARGKNCNFFETARERCVAVRECFESPPAQ